VIALPLFLLCITYAAFSSGHVLQFLGAMKLWLHFLYEFLLRRRQRKKLSRFRKGRHFLLAILLISACAQSLFIERVTSQTVSTYYPSEYNLLDGTAFVSGSLTDLQSDDGIYMTFRSYAGQMSEQTLYAHQETTTIAGTNYYLQKLESADTVGTNLSVSMASTGRQLWGEFVYSLTGVASIPASTWTVYYRTWHSSMPEEVSINSPSSIPFAVWSNAEDAYLSDDVYASTSVSDAQQQYQNYGFNLPSTAVITRVEVGYEAYTDGDERIGITLSWDGGITWAAEYVSPTLGTTDPDTVTWVDFTAATSWTLEKLSNASLLTKVRAIIISSRDEIYLDWFPMRVTYIVPPSAQAEVDILIRRSDGTIRQTIASDVAYSGILSTTAQTLSGTYSWPGYTVVDETDYIEVDYYLNVTVANSGVTAYLRIDDSSLDIINQTRVAGVVLPSEYVTEVEFAGSSNTDYWSQLVWTVDSSWTTDNVSVTLQLYNYAVGTYLTSGDGYIEYTSSATSNTDETRSQIITTNPTNFRNASGNWKIKIKGVKFTTSQFDFKVDLIKFETTSIAPPDIAILNVTVSSTSVYSGGIVTVNVTVNNEGGTTETFNVTTYANNTEIGKQTVSNLAPNTNATLIFNWNTTDISSGTYIIKAVADIVSDEEDTADNTYVNGYVTIFDVHDVAVIDVTVSPKNVIASQNVNVTILVKNEGSVSETFNVTAYYNSTAIETQIVANLVPGANKTLYVIWNTTGVSIGNYTIRVEASNVTDETDTTDNIFVDGIVSISMLYVHDVAVIRVTPSATEVYIEQTISILVVVKNEGTAAETFNVTIYLNETAIETQKVIDLTPSEEKSLTFYWNTTGFAGNSRYIVKAVASQVFEENDKFDNVLESGIVTLKSSAQPSISPFFIDFPYAIPIGLIAVLFLLVGLFLRRRKSRLKFVGFRFFDEITNGGIPEASSVMITGGPSSGKSVLSQQLAFNHLENGKTCIYISYDCFPDEVRQNMKDFLWDISMYEEEGSFCFIDCYSQIAGVKSKERYSIDQPFSLSDLGIMISKAMGSLGQKSPMVVLDSTAPLFARIDSAKVLEFIQDRSARIKGENGIFLFIVGKGTVSADHINKLEEIVDCIIELQAIEEKGKIARKLRIKKLRGRNFVDAWIPFRIESRSGINFLAKKRK
jgi:KaiC/GvpD/RAD55 family RecA-like ATPase